MDLILNSQCWDELKIKLKEKFPQLTETDLKYNEGEEISLFRMVEYKLRKTKKEMREIIAGL